MKLITCNFYFFTSDMNGSMTQGKQENNCHPDNDYRGNRVILLLSHFSLIFFKLDWVAVTESRFLTRRQRHPINLHPLITEKRLSKDLQ